MLLFGRGRKPNLINTLYMDFKKCEILLNILNNAKFCYNSITNGQRILTKGRIGVVIPCRQRMDLADH